MFSSPRPVTPTTRPEPQIGECRTTWQRMVNQFDLRIVEVHQDLKLHRLTPRVIAIQRVLRIAPLETVEDLITKKSCRRHQDQVAQSDCSRVVQKKIASRHWEFANVPLKWNSTLIRGPLRHREIVCP